MDHSGAPGKQVNSVETGLGDGKAMERLNGQMIAGDSR